MPLQTDLPETVLRRIDHLGLPAIVGVLPLVSYKNAEFLRNEVPAMQIPAAISERIRKTPGGEARARNGSRSRARCCSRYAPACRAPI